MSLLLCPICMIKSSLLCSGCKAVAYCGREHQVAHWKSGHKVACTRSTSQPTQETPYTALPADLSKINRDELCFEIKKCENGLGGFAKREIKQGEVVVSDKPLVVVKSEFSSLDEARVRTESEYQKLSASDKEIMDSLFNAFPERGRSGILQSNALPVDETRGGLFPYIARMNHSCNPNANQVWNEDVKEQRLYALRDIKEGEEIFYSYIGSSTLTYQERQAILKQHFKFDCKCKYCLKCQNDLKFREVSDKNRKDLARIRSLLSSPTRCSPKDAIALVNEAKEIIKREEIAFGELGPVCFDAYAICVKSTEYKAEAKDFITTAHAAYSVSCGKEDSSTKLMRSLMEKLS